MLNFRDFSNYFLSTLLISSNLLTTYYVYPIIADFIDVYGTTSDSLFSKGLYIGCILGLYEVFRIAGSYIWKIIANYLGISMSINISLFLLTIVNFSFCFIQNINHFILIRTLTGLFNNLSTFSKHFILVIFSHNEHKMVVKYISFYQNFSLVLSLLSGLIPHFISINLSVRFNKYSILPLIVALLNLVTLVFSMIKFKFKVVIPRRRTQFHEQIDVNLELSQRRDSLDMQNAYNSHFIDFKKYSSGLKNPNKENSNLDIYSSNTDKSAHLNALKIGLDGNLETVDNNENKKSISINIEKEKDIDKEKEKEKYFNINEESKYSENKFSGKKQMMLFTDKKSIHSNISNQSDAVADLEIIPKKQNENKEGEIDHNENIDPNENLDQNDQNEVNKNRKANLLRNSSLKMLTESTTTRNLISNTFNNFFTIFEITSIFTILQICDVILYNILLINLMINTNGFEIYQISLFLALYHLLYLLLSPIINSLLVKFYIQQVNKLELIFKVFTYIASLLTIIVFTYDLFLSSSIDTVKIFILMALILIRNLCLTVVLTSYNLLVFNISNSLIKEKIQSYHTYFSFLMRGVFIIISCFLYNYFMKSYFFILLFFCGIPIGLLLLNFVLLKSLIKII